MEKGTMHGRVRKKGDDMRLKAASCEDETALFVCVCVAEHILQGSWSVTGVDVGKVILTAGTLG